MLSAVLPVFLGWLLLIALIYNEPHHEQGVPD
jgi:hypothetical protein